MTSEKTNILITGATGFLGKAIINAFEKHDNVNLVAACRDSSRLPAGFNGEVRQGDLRDADYLNRVVKDIDVVCHTGTWAAMWAHRTLERENFFRPTINLIEAASRAGVNRFLMTSTVAIAKKQNRPTRYDDFSATDKTGFWPHLDYLVDVDNYMKDHANRGMTMINMRLGHFIGAGNTLGLVPVLVPRLKTYLVPWLAGGNSRMPLVADDDLGDAYVKASLVDHLNSYESFNICGADFPTSKEVIRYIAQKTNSPAPLFSVPYPMGYAFAWTMEKLFPIMPGKAPFLTRSVVHLVEEWVCPNDYATQKLGYVPRKDWRTALNEALAYLESKDYPWPQMTQSRT